jgi:L-threonylcarbamoyladenylate synthase
MKIARVRGTPDTLLLDEAARCVAAGGTIVFPTDTVYGIGCAPEDDAAVERIFSAKRRPTDKPLAIHLARPDDAAALIADMTRSARAVIERCWPGPVTIVVGRPPQRFASAARGGATIALRCPDDAVCRAILEATGPLAATSANVSGAPAYRGDDDVSGLPDASLAIIAGPTKQRRESTVLDCSSDRVRILRHGALDDSAVAQALAGVAVLER